jgi:hypothetical protein
VEGQVGTPGRELEGAAGDSVSPISEPQQETKGGCQDRGGELACPGSLT